MPSPIRNPQGYFLTIFITLIAQAAKTVFKVDFYNYLVFQYNMPKYNLARYLCNPQLSLHLGKSK